MHGSALISANDALQSITDLLVAKQSSAAYGHYPTLRIQTQNLHFALQKAIREIDVILDCWSNALKEDARVSSEFQDQNSLLYSYRKLAPILVRNVHQAASFLLDETRPAPAVDHQRVAEINPSYSDFVRLGGAVRNLLDALVQAAYQLSTFDGLQFNYKFLQSLLSFAVVAPPALHTNLVSPKVQSVLDAYVALSNKDKKGSAFTRATHEQFPQRLLVASQQAGLPDWRRKNIELLFSFCSDFVHSGYVSIFVTGHAGDQFILGGPGDAFTPRAENIAELRQRLLGECAGAYAELLAPILKKAIDRTLVEGFTPELSIQIDTTVADIMQHREILSRVLVEPVRKGAIESGALGQIDCMCGGHVDLKPPYHEWGRYCHQCGSRFHVHEVEDYVDYVISPMGVGDVLGGDAPKISELDTDQKAKLGRIVALHMPKRDGEAIPFVQIADLKRCDEKTLEVSGQCTSAPSDEDRKKCELMAFVAAKSLERCETLRITCNCNSEVDYATRLATNICTCGNCGRTIGLLGVAGNGRRIPVRDPDGTPRTAPIQAHNRFMLPGIATS